MALLPLETQAPGSGARELGAPSFDQAAAHAADAPTAAHGPRAATKER